MILGYSDGVKGVAIAVFILFHIQNYIWKAGNSNGHRACFEMKPGASNARKQAEQMILSWRGTGIDRILGRLLYLCEIQNLNGTEVVVPVRRCSDEWLGFDLVTNAGTVRIDIGVNRLFIGRDFYYEDLMFAYSGKREGLGRFLSNYLLSLLFGRIALTTDFVWWICSREAWNLSFAHSGLKLYGMAECFRLQPSLVARNRVRFCQKNNFLMCVISWILVISRFLNRNLRRNEALT